MLAETLLDASLVAERQNQYSLAREYAERSKALYERVSDHEYVGKLLNNLGQLRAITGKPEEAVPLLHRVVPDRGRAGQPRGCRFCGLLAGLRQASTRAITKVRSRVDIARSSYWVLAWNTEKKKGTLES